MYKVTLSALLIITALGLKAQPVGYSPVTNPGKFKEQFTAVAKKTESIKSDFVQEKKSEYAIGEDHLNGKFWFKKESLLRMEYYKPYQYLMILNKDNFYMKDGEKETKIAVRSNKIFQQVNKIIIDCVQGAVFNNPDFAAIAYENKSGYLIQLTPATKGLKEFFKTIDVIIDKKDYSVTTILMSENSGDSTTLHFTNRELNTVINDALFTIK